MKEAKGTLSNYWLNTIILNDIEDSFFLNLSKKKTLPVLLDLYMQNIYKNCFYENLDNTEWAFERIVTFQAMVTMTRRKICYILARADYGLLSPLIEKKKNKNV